LFEARQDASFGVLDAMGFVVMQAFLSERLVSCSRVKFVMQHLVGKQALVLVVRVVGVSAEHGEPVRQLVIASQTRGVGAAEVEQAERP
jgi:hypothetical protein